MSIEQLKTEEVKINLYDNITKEAVVKAVNEDLLKLHDDIMNEEKKAAIVGFIREGKTKELQKELGMKEDIGADLKERVDNMFGKKTLANLKSGKVVETIEVTSVDGKIENIAKVNFDVIKGLSQKELVDTYHLVGPDIEGDFFTMPGYEWANEKDDNEYAVIKEKPITRDEVIKDLKKHHLEQATKDSEITPAAGYIWANEKDDNDYRVIGNEYELKTKNNDELIKIALGTKAMKDADYKALNQYDLMIIYKSNPKFNFGKDIVDDKKDVVDNTTKKEVGPIKTIEDITVSSVKEFIKIHPKCFDLSKFDTNTVSQIDGLLSDGDKKATLQSIVNIGNNFWNGYTLGAEEISLLVAGMGEKFDTSDVSDVFHTNANRSYDEENDYVGLKKVNGINTIVRNGNIGETKVFEVDGTGAIDDERFDSVNAFFLWLKNKGNIPTEKIETSELTKAYKDRFDSKIAIQALTDNIKAIEDDTEKKKTFVSLLNLDDAFWGKYKLTIEDITAFKNGMAGDAFDFSIGSDTVFHKYTDDPENDYNTLKNGTIVNIGNQGSTKVFEVDGTGTIDDERFDSVNAFFARLKKKVA